MNPKENCNMTGFPDGYESNDDVDMILNSAKSEEGKQDFNEDEKIPSGPPLESSYKLKNEAPVSAPKNITQLAMKTTKKSHLMIELQK